VENCTSLKFLALKNTPPGAGRDPHRRIRDARRWNTLALRNRPHCAGTLHRARPPGFGPDHQLLPGRAPQLLMDLSLF
jgi:hypothetical protein